MRCGGGVCPPPADYHGFRLVDYHFEYGLFEEGLVQTKCIISISDFSFEQPFPTK